MGVTGLWSILSELSERKDIKYLCDKRVAVDLSGWVVQAIQCKGLSATKNPHLRNLFYRVSNLLLNGAHPIFILEGKVPDLKQAAFKKRNYQGNNNSDNVSRPLFDRILNQCHDLLTSLGVPCIKSSGEAEAFCAFLCAKGIVHGVITNDNDTFLYGADTVYRDFSIDPKDPHINMYSLKSAKNKLKLNQQNLIAFALLLGCDYVSGVPGVGKEAALKLFKELEGYDLLQRFQDWKQKSESELFPGYETDMKKKETHCTRCSHLGSTSKHKKEGCSECNSKITCYLADSKNPCTCAWHKNNDVRQKRKNELKVYTAAKSIPDFPNAKVIEEYLKFNDEIPHEDVLDWQCPDLKQFQDKAFHYLGWTFQNSFEKCFPIVTSWQQFKLSRNSLTDKITLLYKPIKILKACTVKGEDCLRIQWVSVDDDHSSDVDEENFCSVEFEDRFKNSYPKMVDEFYNSLEKSKPKPKSKSKKMAKPEENRKVMLESTPSALNKVPSPEIHVRSFTNELYESFSEMPLSERIKMITQLKTSQYYVPNMISASSVTSKMTENHISTKDVCDKIFNESSRSNIQISPKFNVRNMEVLDNPEIFHSNSTDEYTGFACMSNTGRKSIICIEFTDSEDSFLEILPNKIINKSNCSSRKSLIVYCQNITELPRFSINLLNTESFDEISLDDRKLASDLQTSLSVSTPIKSTSPKLLYTVKQSSSNSKKCVPISIHSSTPFAKSSLKNSQNVANFSTPMLSNFNVSSQTFSPLIFNSSNDYTVCSP